MILTVRFLVEAADDLEEGFHIYEQREPGVGRRLIDEVSSCIERIVEAPQQWQQTLKNCRRCRVHQFPYDVVYQLRKHEILIVAVMQLNRRPGYWKKRIE
jgi:plasmid stabilization system protein ParE